MPVQLLNLNTRGYSTAARSLTASGTSMARAAANRLQAEGREIIDLTIGELALDPHEIVSQAAVDSIRRGETRYSDTIGLPALRELLAQNMTTITGCSHDRSNVAINAGAKPGLFITWQILLEKDDEVILPTPHWQTFPFQIRLCGGRPVHVAQLPNGQPDIDGIQRSITSRTKAILVNTPNNPTGVVYSKDSIKSVASIAMKEKLWVVFDQCYRNFIYDGQAHHHILELEPELFARTITIDSFSKALAIAGWRVGYTVGPSDFIDAMRSFQSHLTSCANVTAQHAALAYLQSRSDEFAQGAIKTLAENRRIGLAALAELRDVPPPPAQGGFYFYLNIGKILAAKRITSCDALCEYVLETAGVATVSGSAFGDPNGLRISYAVSPEKLTSALPKLVASLNGIS